MHPSRRDGRAWHRRDRLALIDLAIVPPICGAGRRYTSARPEDRERTRMPASRSCAGDEVSPVVARREAGSLLPVDGRDGRDQEVALDRRASSSAFVRDRVKVAISPSPARNRDRSARHQELRIRDQSLSRVSRSPPLRRGSIHETRENGRSRTRTERDGDEAVARGRAGRASAVRLEPTACVAPRAPSASTGCTMRRERHACWPRRRVLAALRASRSLCATSAATAASAAACR